MTNFSTDIPACEVYNCNNNERTHNIDTLEDKNGVVVAWVCEPCADRLFLVIKAFLKGGTQ